MVFYPARPLLASLLGAMALRQGDADHRGTVWDGAFRGLPLIDHQSTGPRHAPRNDSNVRCEAVSSVTPRLLQQALHVVARPRVRLFHVGEVVHLKGLVLLKGAFDQLGYAHEADAAIEKRAYGHLVGSI